MTSDMTTTDRASSDAQVSDETVVIEGMRATRDAMTVGRVFGDPYTVGDATIIPVARLSGGAGGGGGEGTGQGEESGRGFGTGFGLTVQPVGVYEVRDGSACWKPAFDANRLMQGSQVLAGIIAVCVTLIMLRRQR